VVSVLFSALFSVVANDMFGDVFSCITFIQAAPVIRVSRTFSAKHAIGYILFCAKCQDIF
jgi:hypothetical protein